MPRIILLTDLSEEYAKNLLKGIVRYSKEHGSWVLCKMPFSYRVEHGIEGILAWAKEWRANGIIAQFYNTDRVDIFRENGIAVIAQDFKSRFTEIPNITGAHRLAGKIGADYFLRKGFRHFAFYGFKDIVWSSERCDGFRDTVLEHLPEAVFYEYQNEDFNRLWYYESAPLIEWLKMLPKPVAMMACDDNQAQYIAEACKQCGVMIPEQIALLGVDNDETICTLSDPQLSSINQSVEKGGYEAAMLMERMIREPDAHYDDVVIYPTHVTTRRSTDIYATGDPHISTVLQYIHQSGVPTLTIDRLTRLVPFSKRLLENRFRQEIGIPIHAYIIRLQVERFAVRLLETNAPIVEIADEMDCWDYKNLARLFKKIKGCTPSEYRVRNRFK
ncbi:MAG: XylR family transcriptional regulator [Rikenellaceae bacterium]|jgi:LacI family transcriptional regulator|nr:XylR family transcriptional regulator [Rikenellaceae bacterium]